MTQKVQQLTEENLKLNQAIEQLKKRGIITEEDNKKPFLFGAEDFDWFLNSLYPIPFIFNEEQKALK